MKDDMMAELERLDRFLEGDDEGDIPIEAMRARGMDFPSDELLDDTALHTKLWEAIGAMAAMGLVLDDTDHLSDRDLYRFLVSDALLVPTVLPMSPGSFCHISPIGGFSNEDIEIYLRYYADDGDRVHWTRDSDEILPPKERPPFDRDRFLPG